MVIPFVKMHGAGNDYVVLDGFRIRVDRPPALARRMSDRHTGIGSDGLIVVEPGGTAAVRMRMWNADGTESGMCGNGLRIAAKFAYEAGHVRERHFPIEVGLPGARRRVAAWVQLHERTVRRVTIELDPPRFERAAIPMLGAPEASALDVELDLGTLAGQCPVRICGVGMGNPHAVLFVDELPTDALLQRLGPAIEHHPLFPERTNVSWARCHPRTATIDMRVWERGTGETRACGSGACAVAAAAIRTGRVAAEGVRVRPPGGELVVHWPGGAAPVRLTGPACEVFRGLWSG